MPTFQVDKYILNACRDLENLTIEKNGCVGLMYRIKGIINLYL